MNGVLKTLLLLSCFCVSISALRHRVYRPAAKRVTGCRDKHVNCPSYARNNHCTSSAYRRWMTVNCALSCGHCSQNTGCRDKHVYCPSFARLNHCTLNIYKRWMTVNCALSCGHCSQNTGCRDKHVNCPSFARLNRCTSTTYWGWMTANCALSCGHCSRDCRDKHINCPYYVRNNYCTSSSRSYRKWMTLNCARSCGHCSNVTGTTPPPDPNPQFQIHSSGYNKCLTVRNFVQRYRYFRRINGRLAYRYTTKTRAALSLRNCIRNSAGQSWRWTSRGQLQSSLNQQCLAVTRVRKGYQRFQYRVAMQPCYSNTSEQEWVCTGGFLKLKNLNLYLVPWVNSYKGGVQVRSNVTNTCLWTRYGTSKSLCENATRPTPTTQMTTSTPQGQWFPIQSTRNKKCLALRGTSKSLPHFRSFAPPFTLTTCNQSSAKQLWQMTKDGQLKLKHNGNCLTVDRFRRVRLRSCMASNQNQRWACLGSKLKMGRNFLAPFMYSGFPFGYSVHMFSSCRYNCDWSRFGSGLPVCDTGKATTIKPTSASITTTSLPATPSTNPHTTTSIPHTTTPTPPVPPTGGLKTPPVPPTVDLKTPPLPPTFDLKTPPLPPTGDLKPPPPFPGNTPATPPVVTTTRPPPPQGNKNIKCGTKGRVGGIVNGTAAAAGSWPWQVGIKTCAHCNITCGGTLINDEWVVTAAHCVSEWYPHELHIVIGEVDQSKKSGHEQRFRCTTIITHEDYAIDARFDKDIALIRLDKYAVFNDHVRPLCMPDKSTTLTEKDLCTVTGFGRIAQNGAKSAQLLQAKVKIVALKTCAQAYQNLLRPRRVTSNMLCAGYQRGGTDACQGDSGGPLTCFDRKNFRFILGGVVSWGVGCAQAGQYGVYTNTALFTPWVEKKLLAFGY